MAKYVIVCEDGAFSAKYNGGNALQLLEQACCIVSGIRNHMLKTDETGLIAKMFELSCREGKVFDMKGSNEQFLDKKKKGNVDVQ